MKIHSALDAGGRRVVRIPSVPRLNRFQAQAIWGIPGNGIDGRKARTAGSEVLLPLWEKVAQYSPTVEGSLSC